MIAALRRIFGHAPIELPPELWAAQLTALPLLQRCSLEDRERIRELAARLLAQKTMTGVGGLELTAAMQLHIAVQACLPVLRLGLHWYRGWTGIVVYPAPFRVRRTVHDADGLAHDIDAELAGEAWDGGPVVLSWSDAAPGPQSGAGAPGAASAANVVIHEFAHKIDLLDGAADGIPPFDRHLHAGLARAEWEDVLGDALERFDAGLELVESEIPRDVDPESPEAERYYARLPLDPYAATDEAEFFAVSSEAYFAAPDRLAAAFPRWFDLLDRFYAARGAR